MTVLPFPKTSVDGAPGAGPPASTAELTGTFRAPSGGRGHFAGTYRLERLLDEHGQLAAAGVFTGELRDADGTRVGTGSRRLTCAAVVGADPAAYELGVGPVDVNLIGFMVTVAEFSLAMGRELAPATPARTGVGPTRRRPRLVR